MCYKPYTYLIYFEEKYVQHPIILYIWLRVDKKSIIKEKSSEVSLNVMAENNLYLKLNKSISYISYEIQRILQQTYKIMM